MLKVMGGMQKQLDEYAAREQVLSMMYLYIYISISIRAIDGRDNLHNHTYPVFVRLASDSFLSPFVLCV
jgi:hypothetical protein